MDLRTSPDHVHAMSHRPLLRLAPVCAAIVAVIAFATPAGAVPMHDVTIVGAVQELPAGPGLVGDWSVTGVVVHVSAATAIDEGKSAVAVGSLVQVKGAPRPDRSIDAVSIKVLATMPQPRLPRPVELTGVIAALPATADHVGDWQVNEVVVHVSAATRIDQRLGPAVPGALVHVRGAARPDGSVDAQEVDVRRPAPVRDCSFSLLHLVPQEAAPAGAEGVVITRYLLLGDGTVREDLRVSVEGLVPQTAYDVSVDGIDAGLIITGADGEGRLFLSTADAPGAEPLPPELRPLAERMTVEVSTGETIVLAGDFQDAETRACGRVEPAYLAIAPLQDAAGEPFGVVLASIRGGVQSLRLAAWSLIPGGTYALLVDGTAVGGLVARPDGTVWAAFSNYPGAGERSLPAEALPVSDLLHAELHAGDGSIVAAGEFAAPPGP